MHDPMTLPTECLISRVRRDGDPSAWRALYERHDERLRAYARKLMGPRISAEHEPDDVVGTVWERMLPLIPRFEAREGRGSFFKALAMKARHAVAELGRKGGEGKRRLEDAGRLPFDTLEQEACEEPGVATRVHRAEVQARVRRCLEHPSLPQAYREVLEAVLIEGCSREEVATRLGLSREGVKKRVQRGRAMLASLLGEIEA